MCANVCVCVDVCGCVSVCVRALMYVWLCVCTSMRVSYLRSLLSSRKRALSGRKGVGEKVTLPPSFPVSPSGETGMLFVCVRARVYVRA